MRADTLALAVRAVLPIALAASFLMLGGSLLWLAVTLRLRATGADDFQIGLLTTWFFAGFVFGGLMAPRMIRRLRHLRAFALFAVLAALTGVGYLAWIDAGFWCLLRFVYGFAAAGYFTAMESWLNAQAQNEVRARAMTFYMTCYYIAVGVGQLLINLWPPQTDAGFWIAALLILLAVAPLWLMPRPQPPSEAMRPLAPRRLWQLSPLAPIGSAVGGVLSGGVHGLLPVVAQDMGLSLGEISYLTAAVSVGPFLVLWLFSRHSDRVGRQAAVMAIALLIAVSALLLFWLGRQGGSLFGLLALAFVMGGAMSSIYPNAIAQAFDRLPQQDYVGAAGFLLLAFSLGGAVGPPLAAVFVQRLGPPGLFLFVAAVALSFLAFLLWRRQAAPAAAG